MQNHGHKRRPTACDGIGLDLVACAYPSPPKVIASVATLMEASEDVTLGNDIDLQTPRPVQSLFNSELPQHFSASRLTS